LDRFFPWVSQSYLHPFLCNTPPLPPPSRVSFLQSAARHRLSLLVIHFNIYPRPIPSLPCLPVISVPALPVRLLALPSMPSPHGLPVPPSVPMILIHSYLATLAPAMGRVRASSLICGPSQLGSYLGHSSAALPNSLTPAPIFQAAVAPTAQRPPLHDGPGASSASPTATGAHQKQRSHHPNRSTRA